MKTPESTYKYIPVLIMPSGEVVPSHNGIAIGVYQSNNLIAIYTNDPKSRERTIERALTLAAGVLGFIALLYIATVASVAWVLLAVAAYLAISMFFLYNIVYDPRIGADQLEERTKKTIEYYNEQVDICPSVTYLTSHYPEGRNYA